LLSQSQRRAAIQVQHSDRHPVRDRTPSKPSNWRKMEAVSYTHLPQREHDALLLLRAIGAGLVVAAEALARLSVQDVLLQKATNETKRRHSDSARSGLRRLCGCSCKVKADVMRSTRQRRAGEAQQHPRQNKNRAKKWIYNDRRVPHNRLLRHDADLNTTNQSMSPGRSQNAKAGARNDLSAKRQDFPSGICRLIYLFQFV
jgi:hypothetical protein